MFTAATRALKNELWTVQENLRSASAMEKDEEIMGVVEEVFVGGTLQKLEDILDMDEEGTLIVPVESVEMYEVIAGMELDTLCKNNATKPWTKW